MRGDWLNFGARTHPLCAPVITKLMDLREARKTTGLGSSKSAAVRRIVASTTNLASHAARSPKTEV